MLNSNGQNSNNSILFTIPMLLIFYGHPLYCIIFESSKKHRTLGKRLMHIVVKNQDGSYLTFSQNILRNIIKMVSIIIPFGFIISVIMVAVSSKKQSIHDMIMNQMVVKE